MRLKFANNLYSNTTNSQLKKETECKCQDHPITNLFIEDLNFDSYNLKKKRVWHKQFTDFLNS